jgi:hypothetical protein
MKSATVLCGDCAGTTSRKSERTTSLTTASSFAGSYGSLPNAGGAMLIEPTSPISSV